MREHVVVIVGGGPTGMMLAGELALAGIDVAIVERRDTQDLLGARAGGLSSRTLEIFDQRGIVDRFLAEGQTFQVAGFASVRLDISDFPTRHNYGLALWQKHIERIMAGWIGELDVTWYRGREVTGFTQEADSVTVELADGLVLRAQYLVGCDGGRSLIRKQTGIAFPGWEPTMSNILAEVEMTEAPPLGIHRTTFGVHSFGKTEYDLRGGEVVFRDGPLTRVMVPELTIGSSTEPTLHDLREALIRVCGTDYGVHNPTWISRFTDMARQAAAYRDRRVLLAGDAAHVHSPVGGQGLNTGVQDAVNLGWKLARVVNGTSPDQLLDSYHAERHPVAARVLRYTLAQTALMRTDDRIDALRTTVAELLSMHEPRTRMAAAMSGLDIHYDLGDGHPLLGRRMPDLEVHIGGGTQHIFPLLHTAQPLLLNLQPRAVHLGAWHDHVPVINAEYDGTWELPALGVVSAPTAVLIRPDGHVAWVGEDTLAGLEEALTMWCGPRGAGPAAARPGD